MSSQSMKIFIEPTLPMIFYCMMNKSAIMDLQDNQKLSFFAGVAFEQYIPLQSVYCLTQKGILV